MNSEIIAIGHELLMGEIEDTNTSFLARELSKVGIPVRWSGVVGDDISDLTQAFSRALDRSDVLITTGGLGPTSDDLTREAAAKTVGEEMTVEPELLSWLEGVFEHRGIDMPPTNVKQAMLIPSAETVPNPQGTAPGWWVRRDGRHIILLPGPPRELQRMWRDSIAHELARVSGAGTVVTRTLKTAGFTEGGIDEMLAGLFGRENPYLGIYAHPDGIHLRMIARAQGEQEAYDLIAPMEAEIRTIVGASIWGVDDDTPGHRAAILLREKRLTLGVIEGASGGALASQLAQIPDNEVFFKGALVTNGKGDVITPGGATLFTPQADGEDRAIAMASAAREIFGTDVGLALTVPTTPITPATPADRAADGTYHVAMMSNSFQRTATSRVSYSRPATMQRSATAALVELVAALDGAE
ncbi:MAG: CinA family nicotinamide mononucleotide deamidase-related protein [Chloroflexi bacterium]|nr:CinA family nicotinamide mononucleotide deamidase-related protein [Chloroflexota bacterium]